MITHTNPLLAYMKDHDIDPYAVNNPLGISVTRGYLGDIAMDKRRCSVRILKAIEECTNGVVTAQSMIDHWCKREWLDYQSNHLTPEAATQ